MNSKKYKWVRKKIRDVIVDNKDEISVEEKIKVKRVMRLLDWFVKNGI